MSENTINKAFRRMGYAAGEITAHGLRTTASTLLNESGKWNPRGSDYLDQLRVAVKVAALG